ncbi:MAG TPA: hypothetical protein VF170_17325 [Planctomycetaceae bacterium]
MTRTGLPTLVAAFVALAAALPAAADPWVTYPGGDGPGKGKHVVLVSGDEEYRSEEALPMLARILSERHGFDTTVLFAINPETGEIDPNYNKSIPGLERLADADLMIIATRWRDLPAGQLKHIDAYLKSGKPVIGLRTATHALKPSDPEWRHYADGYDGPKKEWEGGFGRAVLGEMWVAHHGKHKGESTRGIIAPNADGHPILRGVGSGDIWGDTDVYTVRLPLPGDSTPLVLGQVLTGMKPTDPPVEGKKNDPMMPIAWIKSYQIPGGEKGQAFTTTMGSSTDLANEALRRLVVNAVYHLLGLEVPQGGTDVRIVGDYEPTPYGFGEFKKGVKPEDFAAE